jgi:hypothetical protein
MKRKSFICKDYLKNKFCIITDNSQEILDQINVVVPKQSLGGKWAFPSGSLGTRIKKDGAQARCLGHQGKEMLRGAENDNTGEAPGLPEKVPPSTRPSPPGVEGVKKRDSAVASLPQNDKTFAPSE